jgi:hypothetical protein
LDSDLRPSIHLCMTHTSSMGSSASFASTDGRCTSILHPRTGAWPTRAWGSFSLSGAWWLRSPPLPSSAQTFGGSSRRRLFLLMRGHFFAARGSHAPSGLAPIPPHSIGYLLFMLLFLYFFVYFWAYLFFLHVILCCYCVWSLWVLYKHLTTLTGGPDF